MPANYPVFEIQPILGTECIGDSLPKINANFINLSASATFASSKFSALSAQYDAWAVSGPYNSNNPSQGWSTLPNGLILQWGTVNAVVSTDGMYDVTFPKAMSQIFNITTSHIMSGPSSNSSAGPCSILYNYRPTGFTLVQDTVGTNAIKEMWMAIGI